MEASWVRVVSSNNLKGDEQYFLSKEPVTDMAPRLFYARDIKGKTIMSEKPGIAIRFSAKEIGDILCKHSEHQAIEVPHDADTRWTRRKKKF